jgi:D-hydroxyproline dehydrogenase subunit alpha
VSTTGDPALRRHDAGIELTSPPVRFTFDGESMVGYAGEVVAAALAASGRAVLGTRRNGSGRGLFCGMGTCQECVVSVNGGPGQRACMTVVEPGMAVASHGYAIKAPRALPASGGTTATIHEQPDILVVGGGPAGLSAATAAALCGAKVALIDERSSLGGQYFKQVAKSHAASADALDSQFRQGAALIDEVERRGVRIRRDSTVWGAFNPLQIAVLSEGRQYLFAPRRLILATGAYERGVPMPGWTLPGYMTTGAAQTLMRAYRVLPGRRVLVAGNGPLNLQVAADLVAAGAKVVAVAEAAAAPGPRHVLDIARAVWNAPGLMRDGLGYLGILRRAGVRVLHRTAIVAASGKDKVEAATLARIDARGRPVANTETEFAVDTVCVGYGFLPSNEIARALGCRHEVRDGALVPVVDEIGQTSIGGAYVVGDAAGMGGAFAAQDQGFIAGCAAAQSLGLAPPDPIAREANARQVQLRRHRAFQRALWRIFAAPRLDTQLATPDTVVCRCEGVTSGEIATAAARDGASLAVIKRQTRAGMGRCQGRYCTPVIAAMVGEAPRDETAFLAPRPPLKPMRIHDLAQGLDE